MTETTNPANDKNQHITEYLTYYINQEEPADSAILLTGEWGCGKTYYIDRFIDKLRTEESKKDENKPKNYIFKISLFGLKTTADLDDQIGQEICYSLEPELGQGARLLGKALTTAGTVWNYLDTPIKIKQDKLQEASKNLSKKLEKFLFDKNKNNIIFVFDDLERTDIPLKELLGHINAFIERDHIKVILIANEKELIKEFIHQEQTEEEASKTKTYISEDDLKNREIYIKFKEKVVGKTFEVQSDLDNTLTYFIQNNPYKEILLTHTSILKDIYKKQKRINLRQLKQTLGDLTHLLKYLEKRHQQHPQFIKELILVFVGVKLAIYTDELTKHMFETFLPSSEAQEEENLYELKPITNSLREATQKYIQETKEIHNNFENVTKKYQMQSWLYPLDIWFDILFTNKITYIKQATNRLNYFIPIPEQPLWMQCYHFPTLDDETFYNLSQQLVENFLSLKKEPFYDLLHIIQLMISWSNNELIDINIETIKSTTQNTLNTLTSYWIDMYINEWRDIRQERSMNFDLNNKTGYGYYLKDNISFQEIYRLFYDKQTEIIKYIKRQQEKKQNASILQSLQENTYEKSIKLLFNPKLRWKPIFHKIEKEKLIDILFGLSNGQLVNFNQILKQRYLNNDTPGEQVTCFYMIAEFLFWHYIKVDIETKLHAKQELYKHIQNYNFKQLLEIIQNVIETIQPFFITESLYQNNLTDLEEYLCNSNQYTQQAIFGENIKEIFQNNLYKYEARQIDELYIILGKRYSNLPVIHILKTEVSFWKDILSYLKTNEWSSKHTIDKINQLIEIIEQSIKKET